MGSRLSRAALVLGVAVAAVAGVEGARAQGLTGQISGAVTDAEGGVVPGASVTIINVGTNLTRETVTGPDGAFVFPDLLAGTFNLSVSLEGFKTYEQESIELGATERVALRTIVLDVGQLEETVTVQAEAVVVQTQTAARSGLITRENYENIALKGRDFAGMLQVLPGVIDTRNREAPGWGSMGGLSINGRASFNFAYDGVTNKDTGSNSSNYAAPGLDSIAEVRVQAANFQAEYGRSSGATINVVTKSGSQEFHGSAAYYKRDDALNGNEFTRRQQGLPRPLYTFDNVAWTLGGPVLLPGSSFNRSRNKLFFFWSQDVLTRTDPGSLEQRRMPTALERAGDFSQTFDSQGRLIHIRDPLRAGTCNSVDGGPACFPGNVTPTSRIEPNGQALLNLLPLPNAVDPTGNEQYNHVFQTLQDWPRNDQVVRMDWNVASQTTFYSRVQFGYEKREGEVSFLGATNGWPQYPSKYEIDTVSVVNTLLHTFNSTTFAELTVGVNWAHQYTSPFNQAAQDRNDRTRVLAGMPQFFPEANPLNVLPQATFEGGLPAPDDDIGEIGVEQRFPFFGYNTLWNFSGSVTKVKGAHNLKTGLFVEHTTRPAQRSSSFNGAFRFDTDGSNPRDTNIGFANALLGSVTEYQESNAHPSAHGQFVNVEWYVQDNWRVGPRFTIDAGARFYYIAPTRSEGDQVAMFLPSAWDRENAPRLIEPVSVDGERLGRNPLTGERVPEVHIGTLAEGHGDAYNGMQVFDETVMDTPPVKVAPRLGFAWDVTGDGRTAVRGGAGAFYDRFSDDTILSLVEQPPLLETRNTYYTTIDGLLASQLTASPRNVDYLPDFDPPVVYNWSLGVQRDVGFNLIADVAYVGNAARNQLVNRELNGAPYGYAFLPENLDETNIIDGQMRPLPDNLLRPYRGFGNIRQREFTGYSNYHSVQASVNRRRAADGLSFGLSYTHQFENSALQDIDPFVPDNHARYYTAAGKRPHTFVVHYSYEVPNLSDTWRNGIVRAIFDNWEVSGITSILSGTYDEITYSFTGVPTGALVGTGAVGGDLSGTRVDFVCNPNLARGERTFDRQFRTECVAPPAGPFLLGNSRGDEYLTPGYVNWDISIFKNIPLGGSRRLQFRLEMYNAFNTDQWTEVDTSAVFDYLTGEQTDANFGRLTGETRDARRVQVGMRLTF
ncbi:MAG: carboxypeptidase regulatory-like domain-containing protein [Vicinamibacteraceae bacterium]